MSDKLRGQVALITGSSRGIGLAIAKAFVAEGAKVIISSRKPDNVAAAADEINASTPNAAIPLPLHIGKLDDHEVFLEKVITTVGLPSILVNNAAANPFRHIIGTTMAGLEISQMSLTFGDVDRDGAPVVM